MMENKRRKLIFLLFAVLSYFLAYFYSKKILLGWMAMGEQGSGTPPIALYYAWLLFAALFVAGVEAFASLVMHGGRRPSPESLFWAACYLLQGLAIGLYGFHVGSLGVWQVLLWHATAVYYVMARAGILLEGGTGNLIVVDLCRGFFSVPWGNFLLRLRSLREGIGALRSGSDGKRRFPWAAAASAAGILVVCMVAWSQLAAADRRFAAIGDSLFDWITSLFTIRFWEWVVYFVLSVPVGMWLFGLIGGALCRRLGVKKAPAEKLPESAAEQVLNAIVTKPEAAAEKLPDAVTAGTPVKPEQAAAGTSASAEQAAASTSASAEQAAAGTSVSAEQATARMPAKTPQATAGTAGGTAQTEEAHPLTAAEVYAHLARWRRLPAYTGMLLMGALSAIYLLFFVLQAAEFAAAAGGLTREALSAPSASEFAVNGFWEVCRILLLNLAVLAAVTVFSARPLREQRWGRRMAVVFAAFGPLFALFDMAKLGVYVGLYGYTPRRFLAGWFLVFLLFFAVLSLVWLFVRIPAVRIGVFVLAAWFAALTLFPVERFIIDSNLARYERGVDEKPDSDVLIQCGFNDPARVEARTRLLLEKGWFVGKRLYVMNGLYGRDFVWEGGAGPYDNSWENGLAAVTMPDGARLRMMFQDGLCTEVWMEE